MHTPPDPIEPDPSGESVAHIAQQALQRYEGQKGCLLPVLHAIQDVLGYIPARVVPVLAQALQLSRAEIHGVISFYPHFRSQAAGAVVLELCRAEACQAMGGETLAQHAVKRFGCDFHETTRDGKLTLEPVYCLGLCAQSPAVMINGRPHARVTRGKLDRLLESEGV